MPLEEYYNYLEYLQKIGVNVGLIDAFANLVSNKNNSNPGPFVESLTEEEVCRAKSYVYKNVRK